ncbi:DNA polymerase III subunit beta, partial [Campylobacter jejuni]|nr:DNA polymerase III subunit beta [Campylobacter jejuni]
VVTEKMRLHFNKDKIIFEGISLDNMEAKTELEIQTGVSEEFNLTIKIKHLLDFLTSIEEEKFTLSVNEPNSAFIVKSQGLSMIIMPMIL